MNKKVWIKQVVWFLITPVFFYSWLSFLFVLSGGKEGGSSTGEGLLTALVMIILIGPFYLVSFFIHYNHDKKQSFEGSLIRSVRTVTAVGLFLLMLLIIYRYSNPLYVDVELIFFVGWPLTMFFTWWMSEAFCRFFARKNSVS